MDVIHVRLPDEVQQVIDRQVAEGRVVDVDTYLTEAARRYAEGMELEGELMTEAQAGIADIDAGRHQTIATPADAESWHQEKMARLRDRLTADHGECPIAWSGGQMTVLTPSSSTAPENGASRALPATTGSSLPPWK